MLSNFLPVYNLLFSVIIYMRRYNVNLKSRIGTGNYSDRKLFLFEQYCLNFIYMFYL